MNEEAVLEWENQRGAIGGGGNGGNMERDRQMTILRVIWKPN